MAIKPLLFTAALLASTPALAEPNFRIADEVTRRAAMRWETGYLVLSAVDLALTVQCIDAGRCVEANPLARSHSPGKMIALKSALTFGHFLFVQRLASRDPKAALRVAQVSVGIQGAVVGLNLRVIL